VAGPAVLALGAALFVEPASRQLLQNNGMAVWLDCPFDVVKRRVGQETDPAAGAGSGKVRGAFRGPSHDVRPCGYSHPIESDDPESTVEADRCGIHYSSDSP